MTNVSCKNCGQDCDIKNSKSDKNPGREYYACPSGCKGTWNGWVDDDAVSASSSAPKKQSGPVPDTNPKCKSCKAPCIERSSNTDKNRGKKFWACQKQCKIWNGWVSDNNVVAVASMTPKLTTPSTSTSNGTSTSSVSLNNTTRTTVPVPPTKKRSLDTEPVPPKTDIKLPKISHYCQECDKILDLDHEVDNNVKRYSGHLNYPQEMLRLHLKSELQEAITSGEYTCESCLGNE
jgi:hypothetical protein